MLPASASQMSDRGELDAVNEEDVDQDDDQDGKQEPAQSQVNVPPTELGCMGKMFACVYENCCEEAEIETENEEEQFQKKSKDEDEKDRKPYHKMGKEMQIAFKTGTVRREVEIPADRKDSTGANRQVIDGEIISHADHGRKTFKAKASRRVSGETLHSLQAALRKDLETASFHKTKSSQRLQEIKSSQSLSQQPSTSENLPEALRFPKTVHESTGKTAQYSADMYSNLDERIEKHKQERQQLEKALRQERRTMFHQSHKSLAADSVIKPPPSMTREMAFMLEAGHGMIPTASHAITPTASNQQVTSEMLMNTMQSMIEEVVEKLKEDLQPKAQQVKEYMEPKPEQISTKEDMGPKAKQVNQKKKDMEPKPEQISTKEDMGPKAKQVNQKKKDMEPKPEQISTTEDMGPKVKQVNKKKKDMEPKFGEIDKMKEDVEPKPKQNKITKDMKKYTETKPEQEKRAEEGDLTDEQEQHSSTTALIHEILSTVHADRDEEVTTPFPATKLNPGPSVPSSSPNPSVRSMVNVPPIVVEDKELDDISLSPSPSDELLAVHARPETATQVRIEIGKKDKNASNSCAASLDESWDNVNTSNSTALPKIGVTRARSITRKSILLRITSK